MYAGRDFSPFDDDETDQFTFDFTKKLGESEIIIGAIWHCTVADDSGEADENAEDHVSIPASFTGSKTTQTVSGLVAGVKYVLQAIIETDQGNTVSLWSHVLCTEPH